MLHKNNILTMINFTHNFFSVVVDHAQDHKTSTGKFECVYCQPITQPIETCKNSANNLEVNGVATTLHYLSNEHKASETMESECNGIENMNTPHNVGSLSDIKFKREIDEQPIINVLQRLDSLFELAVIKKCHNDMNAELDKKRCACGTQMCTGCTANFKTGLDNERHTDMTPECNATNKIQKAITEPDDDNISKVNSDNKARTCQTQMSFEWERQLTYDDNLDVNQIKRACVQETQTYLTWKNYDHYLYIKPNKRPHALDTQTDLSLIKEPENYGFGPYNSDVDRYKKTIFSILQTEINSRLEPNDNHIDKISIKKKAQIESYAITKMDFGNRLDVNSISATGNSISTV